jgi:hypothetical protein
MRSSRNHWRLGSPKWVVGCDNAVLSYEVHSAVWLIEFDMYKGVFPNNDELDRTRAGVW